MRDQPYNNVGAVRSQAQGVTEMVMDSSERMAESTIHGSYCYR